MKLWSNDSSGVVQQITHDNKTAIPANEIIHLIVYFLYTWRLLTVQILKETVCCILRHQAFIFIWARISYGMSLAMI
jgi:hypothetical protein